MSKKKLLKTLKRKLIEDDAFISNLRKAIAYSEKKGKKKEAQPPTDAHSHQTS